MLTYAVAFLLVYGLFRLFAPAQAQVALDRARTDDWVACGMVAGVVALLVSL